MTNSTKVASEMTSTQTVVSDSRPMLGDRSILAGSFFVITQDVHLIRSLQVKFQSHLARPMHIPFLCGVNLHHDSLKVDNIRHEVLESMRESAKYMTCTNKHSYAIVVLTNNRQQFDIYATSSKLLVSTKNLLEDVAKGKIASLLSSSERNGVPFMSMSDVVYNLDDKIVFQLPHGHMALRMDEHYHSSVLPYLLCSGVDHVEGKKYALIRPFVKEVEVHRVLVLNQEFLSVVNEKLLENPNYPYLIIMEGKFSKTLQI